jgi:hypothetical protein
LTVQGGSTGIIRSICATLRRIIFRGPDRPSRSIIDIRITVGMGTMGAI